MQSAVLGYVLSGNSSRKELSKAIFKTLQELDVELKLFAVITDNDKSYLFYESN